MANSGNIALHTLRKQRNVAKDQLDQYKLLVDHVQEYAIFLLDPEGVILTWSEGAEKIKGYKPDEIIGKHFSIFYTPEDITAQKPKKELEIAKKFGRVEDEYWRIRKDGSRFWAVVVITALRDTDGELIGFGKVTRDLTERKLQEDQLRKANNLLKMQQKELTRLTQSKDEFISLASHQLRTPATAVKQLLGLYVDGLQTGLPEQHMSILTKAYASNERMIQIINNLLKVAQVDAGKVNLKIEYCDVAALMEEIIEDFREISEAKKQNIRLKNVAKSSNLLVDKQNLRMALENILTNASKYTYPHGSIDIHITRRKNMFRIAISDNGVGIAKRDISNLFEKFSRLPNDLSEEVGGTGLGLYWASKIILLHGGQIEVESELNEGSTFTVCLPVSD